MSHDNTTPPPVWRPHITGGILSLLMRGARKNAKKVPPLASKNDILSLHHQQLSNKIQNALSNHPALCDVDVTCQGKVTASWKVHLSARIKESHAVKNMDETAVKRLLTSVVGAMWKIGGTSFGSYAVTLHCGKTTFTLQDAGFDAGAAYPHDLATIFDS